MELCKPDSLGIYNIVDIEAEFPGGISKLSKCIFEYMSTIGDNIQLESISNIALDIYIDDSGNHRLISLNGNQNSQLNLTEMYFWKAFESLPRWIPAKCGDKAVPSYLRFVYFINYN